MENKIFDESIKLKDNAMLKHYPYLADDLDFNKNKKSGIDIYTLTKGSGKKIWWICKVCNSSYDCRVSIKNRNDKCPYCTGRKVNNTNSLASLNPDLASQWHPTKNGNLSTHDVTCGSDKKVWWKCSKHDNHEWEATVKSRSEGKNCPYCAKRNPKVLKGFNDMWTTNPRLASKLLDPEDGYKFGEFSNKITNWKCECGQVIKDKRIHATNIRGLNCPNCSDEISIPEKIMYCLLRKLNVYSNKEQTFNWSQGRRYDFYIPSLNAIVEVHGAQHYIRGFETYGSRSLEDEQRIDKLKRELAISNGIENYIEVECRISDLEYIEKSIKNSDFVKLFNIDNIDFEELRYDIDNSLVITVWNHWDSGIKSVEEISRMLNLDKYTVYKYLKRRESL